PLYLPCLVFSYVASHERGSDRAARGGHAPHGHDADEIVPSLDSVHACSRVAGSVRVLRRETRTVARAMSEQLISSHHKEESNHVAIPLLRRNGCRQSHTGPACAYLAVSAVPTVCQQLCRSP